MLDAANDRPAPLTPSSSERPEVTPGNGARTQEQAGGVEQAVHILSIEPDFDDQYGHSYRVAYSLDSETVRVTEFARQGRHDDWSVVGGQELAESHYAFGEIADIIASEVEGRDVATVAAENLTRAREWLAFREGAAEATTVRIPVMSLRSGSHPPSLTPEPQGGSAVGHVVLYRCDACPYETRDPGDGCCPCERHEGGVEIACTGTLVTVPLWCAGCQGEVGELAVVGDATGPLCHGCADERLARTQRIPTLTIRETAALWLAEQAVRP